MDHLGVKKLEEEIKVLKDAPGSSPEPMVDVDALRVLLNKIYDAETDALCEISNEEAAQTLKLMSEKLD